MLLGLKTIDNIDVEFFTRPAFEKKVSLAIALYDDLPDIAI